MVVRDGRSVGLRLADMKRHIEAIEEAVERGWDMFVIKRCEALEEEARDLKQLYKHTTLY